MIAVYVLVFLFVGVTLYALIGMVVAFVESRRDLDGIRKFHADHPGLSDAEIRDIGMGVLIHYVWAWPRLVFISPPRQGPPRQEMLP